jgi:DNA-binding IclR family transcriptional regulator
MVDLATALNEAVYLVTKVGTEAMFQEIIDCHHPIKVESFIGRQFPFSDVFGAGCGPAQFDAEGLRVHIHKLKEEVTSVSVPVPDGSGKVSTAIVVLAPTFRLPMERINSAIAGPVSVAGYQLSLKLGAVTPKKGQECSSRPPLDYSNNQPVFGVSKPADYWQRGRQCHH